MTMLQNMTALTGAKIYQETLNESLREHEQISRLARERGWYNSYGNPDEQLQQEMKLSATRLHLLVI